MSKKELTRLAIMKRMQETRKCQKEAPLSLEVSVHQVMIIQLAIHTLCQQTIYVVTYPS